MTSTPPSSAASLSEASESTVTTSFAAARHAGLPNLSRSQGRKAIRHGTSAWVYATVLVVAATIAYTASSSSTAIFSMLPPAASLGPVFGPSLPTPPHSAIKGSKPKPSPHDSISFSPLLLVTGAGSHGLLSIRREALLSLLVKPIVVELGAVVLCQAVGLPLLSKLGVILRRMRVQGTVFLPHSHHVLAATRGLRTLLGRRFPPAARRVAIRQARVVTTRTGKAWKAFGHVYKQTSLSKIVNRGKKLLKVFVVHKDLHDDDDH